MKAVILTEKFDTKFQSYSIFLSKPMLPFEEKPIFKHIINLTGKKVTNHLTKKHIKNIIKN